MQSSGDIGDGRYSVGGSRSGFLRGCSDAGVEKFRRVGLE